MEKIKINFNGTVFDNYSNLVSYIIENLRKYNKTDGTTNSKDLIKILMSTKELLVKGKNCNMYDSVVHSELLDLYINMITCYSDVTEIEVYRAVLSSVITMTDNSELICEKLMNLNFSNILLDETIKVCLPEFKDKLKKGVTVEQIVAQLILIIHNIARHNKYQQGFIQNENVKTFKIKLRKFLISKDKRMTILAMSVLIWLSEDNTNDNFLLEEHCNIISNFTEYINKGTKDKGRWFEGLNVWELLSVLRALSCMDSIKHENFLTSKCITMLANILKSKDSLINEIDLCLEILWHLSFTDNDRNRLKNEFKIESAIKTQIYNDNEEISNKALELLKSFSDSQAVNINDKELKYDIFISYCHAQNDIIKAVAMELKGKFNIWIDTEKIKGSPLNDIADGIQKSKVILMGVSNSYKQSACCRNEACYAQRLKKKIIPLLTEKKYQADGWLGLIMYSELYIDYFKQANIKSIVEKIDDQMNAV